jgi:hypothetical protein
VGTNGQTDREELVQRSREDGEPYHKTLLDHLDQTGNFCHGNLMLHGDAPEPGTNRIEPSTTAWTRFREPLDIPHRAAVQLAFGPFSHRRPSGQPGAGFEPGMVGTAGADGAGG